MGETAGNVSLLLSMKDDMHIGTCQHGSVEVLSAPELDFTCGRNALPQTCALENTCGALVVFQCFSHKKWSLWLWLKKVNLSAVVLLGSGALSVWGIFVV